MGKTLAEKIWDDHVVRSAAGEPDLLYIDLHLIHEVTSPQAFDGLRQSGRTVSRPDLTLATDAADLPQLAAAREWLRTAAAEGAADQDVGRVVEHIGPGTGARRPR